MNVITIQVDHVWEWFRARGFVAMEHGREGKAMEPTRIREPTHYELRAEGFSFELHRNATGQWILTYNGRTWTEEQFASFMESGPLGRMITLDTTDPAQPNRGAR